MAAHLEQQDYGEKIEFDPNFHGPTRDRYATDSCMCYVFVVFIVLWFAGGLFAVFKGDLRVLQENDTMSFVKNKCTTTARPNVLYFDVRTCRRERECETPSVCVSSCPNRTFIYNTNECTPETLASIKANLTCQSSVNVASLANCEQVATVMAVPANCPRWYFPSKLVSRRCVPTRWTYEELTKIEATETDMRRGAKGLEIYARRALDKTSEKILSDIKKTWPSIVVAILGGTILAILMVFLLRWLAGPIVWGTIIFNVVILVIFIYLARNEIIIAIMFGVILILMIISVFCLRHKIMAAIAMIEICSSALFTIPMSIFFPFLPCIFELATDIFVVFVFIKLVSMFESSYKVSKMRNDTQCNCTGNASNYRDGGTCDTETFITNCVNCMRASCKENLIVPIHVGALLALNLVGKLWITFFFTGITDVVLAFTFGTWYWTWEKEDVPRGILGVAIRIVLKFHMGTVALGALILTIVELIRIVLESIRDYLMENDNPIAAVCLSIFICLYDCFQRIIGFLTHNAYIVCGLHGSPFCESAKLSFRLIMRNAINFFTISNVTDMVFCVSKLLVSFAVGGIVYGIWSMSSNKLNDILVPVLLSMLGTFLVCSILFRVYSVAVDTIFLCFLEDTERNDGSSARPYYVCDERMWQILGPQG